MAGAYLNSTGGFQHNSVALQVCTYLVNARLNVNIAFTPVAVLGGGLRGLEHPPRSKFRLQRELTGVINSFSSAKTHCGEPTRSYNPFGHKRAHFCALFGTHVCIRNIEYSLSAWRHLTFKNAPALLEVVGRALEVVGGALK